MDRRARKAGTGAAFAHRHRRRRVAALCRRARTQTVRRGRPDQIGRFGRGLKEERSMPEIIDPRAALKTLLADIAALPGDESSAPMLPRECYTSPAFFEFEREAVFAASWMCVGRAEQIPEAGDYLAV